MYCEMAYLGDCHGQVAWYVVDDNAEIELCGHHAVVLRKEADVQRI